MSIKVVIQTQDFDLNTEVAALKSKNIGAIVSFLGCVRDMSENTLISLTLEHYPNMSEKTITDIINQAHNRWAIQATTVIHRVGTLKAQDNIVLVACASVHRSEAFLACEFIMDFLKTDALFWKKETSNTGEVWIKAKTKDIKLKEKWHQK